MCKYGLKRIQKSISFSSLVKGIDLILIPILLLLHLADSTYAVEENIAQSQYRQSITLQQKKIVKIEFVIDKRPVIDTEKLSKLQELIKIKIGSPFSRYAVQRSVASIYSSQQYSQVDVYTIDSQGGVILNYELYNVIRIKDIKIVGISSDELRRAIISAIKLKKDDIYVQEIAYDNVKYIKAICEEIGYFNISVKINPMVENGIITFQITLGNPTVVSVVNISGNSSIFLDQIKDVCNPQVNTVYNKSVINEDIRAIEELYRQKYYPSTKIVHDFNQETGVLTYNIIEGKQLLIDFVDDNGEPILQDSIYRKILSFLEIDTEEQDRYQLRKKIEAQINDRTQWTKIVKGHFEAKGYHGTVVESKVLTNAPLHVEFTVIPGTRYIVSSVEFTGNRAFLDNELLREMELKPANFFSRYFRKRFFSDIALERDKNRLEILYEKAGYQDVKITSKLNLQESNRKREGNISIHLTFVEPYKEMIHRCLFIGNMVLDNTTLYDALPTKPPEPNAPLVKKNYEDAILKAYQDRGYIYAIVESIDYFDKMETPTIQVNGNFTDQLSAGNLHIQLRDAFERNGLSLAGTDVATIGDEWSIQDVDGNARYTLVQKKDNIDVYEHGILQFDIYEGDKILFGKFNFVGDLGVVPNVLNREVSNLPGTLFIPDRLNGVIQNLYNTRIFEPGIQTRFIPAIGLEQTRNIDNDGLHNPSSSIYKVNDVEIKLQKRGPRSYAADVGYGTADGPRGTIEFGHLNLFKRNVRLNLRGRWGTRGYLYETVLTEPWLIGRTSGSLQFLGRKLEEDDDVRALQGSFTLSRKLPGSHRLNLRYSYRYLKDTSIIDTSLVQQIPNSSTTVSSLSFLWRQDSRAPSLNPISGILNEVSVEYAGGVLGGESGFIKFVSDTRLPIQLNTRGFVLFTALRMGYTPGLQTNDNDEAELISFERFWAGGSTTVRGYEERGLGPEDVTGKHRGNVQLVFNSELRFPILAPIQGVLFFDSGNVWGSVEDIEYKWLPSSVGVGLRLNFSPLIIGIDYAVPLLTLTDVPTNPFYFRIGNTF